MSNKKVLVVDDDKILCDGIAYILHDEGYIVHNTSEPVEAVDLIIKQEFDLAIFDYKMSNITGVDLIKMIKGKNIKTKIIMISGRPFIEKILAEEKISHLVETVITKPFDINTLLDKIKNF